GPPAARRPVATRRSSDLRAGLDAPQACPARMAGQDPPRGFHAGRPARRLVAATNSSSLARAAPLAMASRARLMPSAMSSATPATYSAAPALRATISRGRPGLPSMASSTISLLWAGLSTLRLRLARSEEHTSELQSRENLVCRLLLEK